MSSLLLFLLLSLSIQECKSRHIGGGIVVHNYSGRLLHHSGKDAEKMAWESWEWGQNIKETRARISGNEIVMSSSHVGWRQAIKLEEARDGRRSMVEYENDSGHVDIVTQETSESTETDMASDYEQPHRTPPINNRSP